MEHTAEPWERSEHKFNAPPFEGTLEHECGIYPVPDGEIGPAAIASGKYNARRIVACVNACAGVTTEELEQGGFVSGLLERIADAPRWQHAEIERLRAQVKRLRDALVGIVEDDDINGLRFTATVLESIDCDDATVSLAAVRALIDIRPEGSAGEEKP